MTRTGGMNRCQELGHLFETLLEKARTPPPCALPRFDNCGRAKREQTDHGTHLEPGRAAIREAQQIIVETILLIPHPIFARLVHSPCNPQEVIGKRGGDVNICWVGTS